MKNAADVFTKEICSQGAAICDAMKTNVLKIDLLG